TSQQKRPKQRKLYRSRSQPQLTQQQPTVDNLLHDIKSMVEGLHDLDVNRLQVVKNKLEHALKEVQRPERDFRLGDWVDKDKNTNLPPNLRIEKQ
ncbi:6080_t:CDS:1, partial [Racocetra fulgida]